MTQLTYLYCLLPGDAQVSGQGIEGMEAGSPVEVLRIGALQAAVSEVGEEFAEANLNARIRDLDWLSPRAVRHHEVVDQLYAQAKPLLPLSFGAIFRSPESLRQRLTDEQQELLARLEHVRGREEWNLKLSRDEAVFKAQLRRHSPDLQRLEAELRAKPPGTRFLLEKKLHNTETREAQRISASVRADVHQSLAALAVEARRDQLAAPQQLQNIRLELRSAYLIEEGHSAELERAAQASSAQYASLGYQLELTGPWPAFTFAGGLREALV